MSGAADIRRLVPAKVLAAAATYARYVEQDQAEAAAILEAVSALLSTPEELRELLEAVEHGQADGREEPHSVFVMPLSSWERIEAAASSLREEVRP